MRASCTPDAFAAAGDVITSRLWSLDFGAYLIVGVLAFSQTLKQIIKLFIGWNGFVFGAKRIFVVGAAQLFSKHLCRFWFLIIVVHGSSLKGSEQLNVQLVPGAGRKYWN